MFNQLLLLFLNYARYKRGAAYEPFTQIVMDSVMDISVFEVSITLFKRLYVSILRGLEIQIVMDDR